MFLCRCCREELPRLLRGLEQTENLGEGGASSFGERIRLFISICWGVLRNAWLGVMPVDWSCFAISLVVLFFEGLLRLFSVVFSNSMANQRFAALVHVKIELAES